MRVLVCGGRDYGLTTEQRNKIYRVLNSLLARPDLEIISGMAKGVDSVAADWAVVHMVKLHEFPANWDKYGKSAGYIRNKQMLDEGEPHLVIAFPGGKGTAMMVDLARKANIAAEIIE